MTKKPKKKKGCLASLGCLGTLVITFTLIAVINGTTPKQNHNSSEMNKTTQTSITKFPPGYEEALEKGKEVLKNLEHYHLTKQDFYDVLVENEGVSPELANLVVDNIEYDFKE